MNFQTERKGFAVSYLVIALLSVLLVASLGFGVWAFGSMSDYKNNSDEKAAVAVASAEAVQKEKLEAEFAEKEKSPYEIYKGSSDLGSLVITYPKTWEMYADSRSNSGTPLDGYAHPGYVPGVTSDTAFALRFQVLDKDYTAELKTFDNDVKQGKVKVSPYRSSAVSSVLGARIDGQIATKESGHLILIPLRDKTLKVWTESEAYLSDYNNIVNTLTFVP